MLRQLLLLVVCSIIGVLAGPDLEYYRLLDVTKTATTSEIKKAYRKMSLKYHPDKVDSSQKESAQKMFRQLTDAYEILGDDKKRRIYDVYGSDPTISLEDMMEYNNLLDQYRVRDLYRRVPFVNLLFGKNIDQLLGSRQANTVWVVTFFHPECGSCQRLVPIMQQLAEEEKMKAKRAGKAEAPEIRVGAVNCALDVRQCHRMGVSQYGVIYIFAPNQPGGGHYDFETYQGPQSVNAIRNAANELRDLPYFEFSSPESLQRHMQTAQVTSRSRIESDPAFFRQIWLVDMYSPGCQPCLALKSQLRSLAKKFKGVINIATIDCSKTRCPARYFPYLQLWVRTPKQIRMTTLNFDSGAHPATVAMEAVFAIFNDLLEVKWDYTVPIKRDEL